MKTVKINVTKIEKARLFKGAKGTYLDLVLIDKPDEYGNDGFVVQGISKEDRDKGVKMPIIGSWKRIQGKGKSADQPRRTAPKAPAQPDLPQPEEDDVPF